MVWSLILTVLAMFVGVYVSAILLTNRSKRGWSDGKRFYVGFGISIAICLLSALLFAGTHGLIGSAIGVAIVSIWVFTR